MSQGVPSGAAVVVLSPAGLDLARRLRTALPDAHIHGLAHRVDGADVPYRDAAQHLRSLFAAGVPIVGVCAGGILVRALAPLLGDKHAEPPVVAVAADGTFAVPLLGGHHGANALAEAVADATGGMAAVTTASEARLGLALDAPPPGWTVADPPVAKAVTAALLAGEPVRLVVEAGDPTWITDAGPEFSDDALLAIRVTDRARSAARNELVLHPPILALGVGCERDTEPAELETLARATLAEHGLAPASVACVISLDLKEDEPAVAALAVSLGVPARFFDAPRLEAETPRLANPSEEVFRAVGCHGVAEASALAAAGTDGVLVVPKRKSARATCAVARARAIDPNQVGRPRGSLTIIGAGPGHANWRTPAAGRAATRASDAVGYGPYLDLMGDALAGARHHAFALGEEEARARRALELAAEGKRVVLVASGDPGIYALASLVIELMDREPAWRRLAVSVEPGVSAMQMAAARAGAPLGHDFCAISLSDLMTPWTAIERRLTAAAEADFVVALYNPRSHRRTRQLPAARDILLAHRPPLTPVVVARAIGRQAESVDVVTLAELDPEAVDMLTVLIVGNSETRAFSHRGRDWVYTPRGYRTDPGDAA